MELFPLCYLPFAHTDLHTYLRQQDFSIVSMARSLVHQPDANYSCNL